jgi:catechol 2,3-dioxygenase-like lactoylglutathione lyase family enzyme
MDNFYARAVFFVSDAEAALAYYTQTLGFALDWRFDYDGRPWVFEVSLHGFCLILNQAHAEYKDHAGRGRAFIGLEPDQQIALREHMAAHSIQATHTDWGRPTLVIRDPDGNELFFWVNDHEAWVAEWPPLHR